MQRTRFTILTAVLLALPGCGTSSQTQLPDLKPAAADSMLPPAQQQEAIEELAKKRAEQEQQAVKKIEQTR